MVVFQYNIPACQIKGFSHILPVDKSYDFDKILWASEGKRKAIQRKYRILDTVRIFLSLFSWGSICLTSASTGIFFSSLPLVILESVNILPLPECRNDSHSIYSEAKERVKTEAHISHI